MDNINYIKDFGNSYPEYSNKPGEAIEYLLKTKEGVVANAIFKDGIGYIDFVYGKTGKDGFGLAHIIERRAKEGIIGEDFVKMLPKIINQGQIIKKEKHKDRLYIKYKNIEITIRLDFDDIKRNWVVSAYIKKN